MVFLYFWLRSNFIDTVLNLFAYSMKCLKPFLVAILLLTAAFRLNAQVNIVDSLQQKLNSAKKVEEKFTLLNQLFGEYMQRGNISKQAEVSKDLLKLAQRSHNDSLLVQAYMNVGTYLVNKADFEASLEFYFKALHRAEELNLTEMKILLNNNIGGEYEDLKNFNEAIKYTKRTGQLLAEKGRKDAMLIFNNWHAAFDYLNLNKTDSALQYLNTASQNIKAHNLTGKKIHFIQAHIYWSYGQVYEKLKNNAEADKYYQKAISYADSLQIKIPLVLALNSYSQFLYNNAQYKTAKQNALKALNQAQQTNFVLEVINSASVLSKIYTQAKMPDSANYYYRLKDEYQEKTFNQQRISRLQDITFTEQIHQAEEQARLAELEEQRKHNLQYAGIAIAIITLVVIFLLLSRSTIASPRLIEFLGVVGLLILFEFINLLLHPFIGEYTHHSPLLMLLIMVVIAALLVPLHHKIEHWMKHKFIGH